MTQEHIEHVKIAFDDELKSLEHYVDMHDKATLGQEKQILRDMAIEEKSHAKHIIELMKVRGVDVTEMEKKMDELEDKYKYI